MAEGTIGGTPISQLPPSSFAYCEPGSEAVSTRCHFPIRDKNGKPDAAHVRNALARLATSPFESKARAKVEAAAKELGIGEPAGKAFVEEMKAEPMTAKAMEQWLSGDRPRRVLVLPFTGPLPGGKAGLDLDGEYFDSDTDRYGPFPALKATRERMVDWHHDNDPTGRMKGVNLGRVVLDEEPEDDGLWADWWAQRGEERMGLIKRLQEKGVPLYGSSYAAFKQKADDGHIEVWPLIRHTITTSPQNTHAVVPSLKAMLTDPDIPLGDVGLDALKAALVGLDDLLPILEEPWRAPTASEVKAGRVLSAKNEAALRRALDELSNVLSLLMVPPTGPDAEESPTVAPVPAA